jgi:diacylglycerol kinase family enzyme
MQALTTGGHAKHKHAIHLIGMDEIVISARQPVPLQADGEYLGEITEVRAEPLAEALPVWT